MTPPLVQDRKPTILVVDDTPPSLFVLAAVLTEFGFDARPVTNGEAALRAAMAEPPELVLLDINMPNMDGFEVCRRLKAEPSLADIPVIFISAYGEMEDKIKAFAAGGVDYVTKPFHAEEVRARITAHLELRRQRQELARSYEQLRRMEETRDNLVHMLVHDLRSPLNGIHGFLDLIISEGDESLPKDKLELLADVRLSSQRMVRMVNDILDVSRMEAGELGLSLARVDLLELVQDVCKQLSPLMEGKSVRLLSKAEPLPSMIDRELIWRVLENLLFNALRFTRSRGEVIVSVGVVEQGVRVSVEDTGPGIPVDYRERIFDKFGRVESRGVGRGPSTGLGLAFCKLAVEAHGGRIGVDSEVTRGSVFWFELPRHDDTAGS